MDDPVSHVVNIDEVQEVDHTRGEHWGGFDKPLTPSMRPKGGGLGVSLSRVPQGRSMCPFHYHEHEDEVFLVVSGRGLLRYGEDTRIISKGDCVSCPAGTKTAHQIANPFEEDLVYLAIGPHIPHEVAVYPDNGKVFVRSLSTLGFLEPAEYWDGEPAMPKIFELGAELVRSQASAKP